MKQDIEPEDLEHFIGLFEEYRNESRVGRRRMVKASSLIRQMVDIEDGRLARYVLSLSDAEWEAVKERSRKDVYPSIPKEFG